MKSRTCKDCGPQPIARFEKYPSGKYRERCRTCYRKMLALPKRTHKKRGPQSHETPMRFDAKEAKAFDQARCQFVIEHGGDPKRYKVENASRIPWPDSAYVPPKIKQRN